MTLAQKLKAIRAREGLTQMEFCDLVGLSLNSLKKYETGVFEMGYGALTRVLSHPQFFGYTLWLMTDQTALASGQLSPE